MNDLVFRRKEMFYLTMHSTNFIYIYMVKDHLDSESANLLPPLHVLLFPISSKGSVITIPQTHTTAFVTLVVEHWLDQDIRDRSEILMIDHTISRQSTTELHLAPF